MTVPRLTASEVIRFLLECSDAAYQRWWPGVHLHMHQHAGGRADHVGDAVFMDEFIGSRRLRITGVVIQVERDRKIVWQMKNVIRLPAWLTIEAVDGADGVAIAHTITAGWGGLGRLLDPLLRLYLSDDFAAAMDEHVHTEFPLIHHRLHPQAE
ncbi:MAG: hypothetical protein U0Q47_06445 [Mycobacterium sp.]